MIIRKPSTLFFLPSKGEIIIKRKSSKGFFIDYYINNQNGNESKVNLPFTGEYSISPSPYKITDIQIIEPNFSLPEVERNEFRPCATFIYLDEMKNNSPASIYITKNIVTISKKFLSYPIEVRIFILLHEIGHFYYKTEWKCDTYAAYHFLKFGCNPSQAFESLAGVLHEKTPEGEINERNKNRIENIFKILTK